MFNDFCWRNRVENVMSYKMSWLYLIIAGISEIVWAYYMKLSNGLTVLYPSVMFIFFMLISMSTLTFASKTLPVSLAYPIWVGIGTIGTVLLGYFYFNESLSVNRLLFIFLIGLGVVGLKLTYDEHTE